MAVIPVRRRARSRRGALSIRVAWIAAGVAALSAAAGLVHWRPDRAMRVVTGLTAHLACSARFVSHVDPRSVYEENVQPIRHVGLVTWALRWEVDTARREARATIAGGFGARAVYRDGAGCTLVNGAGALSPVLDTRAVDSFPAPSLSFAADTGAVETSDARLRAALDSAFAEPDATRPRQTKAVIVVHDGRVIAERYAPGYGVRTPLLGWSATKSATSALVAILVRQGKLTVDQRAPVTAWAGASDPRRAITVDELLRMTSGLAIDETGSGFDPVSRMLYVEADMGTFAERSGVRVAPGTDFRYTSGNTLILSRIVRDAAGGGAGDVVRFARRELFAPLGMRSAVLELDASGTPVGSTFMYATARDWARFGMLFLADGVVGGRRSLPEGWVPYASRSTLGTHYGAGVWLGEGRQLPPGSVIFNGAFGQHVAVIPSEQLIVARFGIAHGDDGYSQLVHAVLDAMRRDNGRGV